MDKKLKIVQVEFLDHCSTTSGASAVLPIVAFGMVISEDRTQIVLAWWASPTEDHLDNFETLSIVKSTITKLKRLGTFRYKT